MRPVHENRSFCGLKISKIGLVQLQSFSSLESRPSNTKHAGDELMKTVSQKGKEKQDDAMDVDDMLGEDASGEETMDSDTSLDRTVNCTMDDMTVDSTTNRDVMMEPVASSHLKDEDKCSFLNFYCQFIFIQFLLQMM